MLSDILVVPLLFDNGALLVVVGNTQCASWSRGVPLVDYVRSNQTSWNHFSAQTLNVVIP